MEMSNYLSVEHYLISKTSQYMPLIFGTEDYTKKLPAKFNFGPIQPIQRSNKRYTILLIIHTRMLTQK